MNATTIHLDRDLAERLARLARATERNTEEVVRDAVDEYLTRHEINDAEWQSRLTMVVARLRAGVPRDEPPAIIEGEISLAREEVRAGRHAGGC